MTSIAFGERIYDEPVRRLIVPTSLAVLSDEEADAGEDHGLEGNHLYRDIRTVGWDLVAAAIQAEAALFDRFRASTDMDAEYEAWRDELEEAETPEEDFYGLDLGVISAVLALSAIGAVTVWSCNAGGFGGGHAEPFPLITMFLPPEHIAEVMEAAEAADVGLDMLEGGLVRLYGRTDFDLHRFAQVALAQSLNLLPQDSV
ncbi:hypothetical protein [Brevundimonas diminuta]|uniref:hypothetical protein n=1 Tax=Brevundimonas diminuta TaxID=293 RepID=UPI0035D73C9B